MRQKEGLMVVSYRKGAKVFKTATQYRERYFIRWNIVWGAILLPGVIGCVMMSEVFLLLTESHGRNEGR